MKRIRVTYSHSPMASMQTTAAAAVLAETAVEMRMRALLTPMRPGSWAAREIVRGTVQNYPATGR